MLVPACGSRCAREGASSEAEPARGGREPSSEAEPARGRREPLSEAEPGHEPSSEAEPARGGRGPSSEAEPARGGTRLGLSGRPRGPPQRGPRRVCVLRLEVCFVLFFCRF
jgi:hypothetical protein